MYIYKNGKCLHLVVLLTKDMLVKIINSMVDLLRLVLIMLLFNDIIKVKFMGLKLYLNNPTKAQFITSMVTI